MEQRVLFGDCQVLSKWTFVYATVILVNVAPSCNTRSTKVFRFRSNGKDPNNRGPLSHCNLLSFGFFKGPSRSCEPNKVFGVATWFQFSIQPLKKSEKQTKVTCWELQAYVIHPRKLDWFVRDVLLSSYLYLIGLRIMGRPRFKLRN